MATSLRPLVLAIISLLTISCLIRSSEGSKIGIYWGQNPKSGNLSQICTNSTYDFVVIAFLNFIGSQAYLELDDHCQKGVPDGCFVLRSQIKFCQDQGIKVFLSLGGRPSLSSDDARLVARNIWNDYLGGQSGARPFDNAVLDGIDFHIQSGSNQNLDVLAEALKNYTTADTSKVYYFSAAPLCRIPDYYLDTLIKTGLFDYVWVQFFNDPSCAYSSGNGDNLAESWAQWHSYLGENSLNTKLFLGLSGNADTIGYIRCKTLRNYVIPYVEEFPNYGGITVLEGVSYCPRYGETIRPYVNSDVL